MEISIKKAKLSKGCRIEAVYTDTDGNEITFKGIRRCHSDLIVSLARLVPYFADLTEQKEADGIDWDNIESEGNVELLRRIEVTGVAVGGDDLNKFIVLSGKRTLNTSKVLNLCSPGVELDSETSEWGHADELDIDVQGFFYEVELYINERKWDDSQKVIDFADNPDDPFAEEQLAVEAPPITEPAESIA